jgi:DMSO/TMAO reductase YedYZ molybdopterin-dependent catalytic subunit
MERRRFGSANGNRTRISALKGPRANRCTIAPQRKTTIFQLYGNHGRRAIGGFLRLCWFTSFSIPQSWGIVSEAGRGIRNRRTLLKQSLISGGVLLSGLHRISWPENPAGSDFAEQGVRIGLVPFSDEGAVAMDVPLGAELDGRLFTDLSSLTPEDAVTPTKTFYIRTRASKLLDISKLWSISLGGSAVKPAAVAVERLRKMAKPMGLRLMECAGNFRGAHFGMVSVAEWRGVPLQEVLDMAKPATPGARILISGFDQYASESRSSIPGASWIFTPEQLKTAGAFFATEMNSEALTPDHGAPVRMVIPDWYGCTCIKWVNEIAFVNDDAPATSQMQEYAGRTGQVGMPALAREYEPALIDYAAIPIRIEKWAVNGKIEFHVTGIQWGGSQKMDGLEIQFNAEESFAPVQGFKISMEGGWNFWRHVWTPQKPGRYLIRLRVKGPGVVARRLNSGYYMRSVEIKEI